MVQKDPIWLQAVDDALASFAYGDTITHEWLAEHLDITQPTGPMSIEAFQSRQWDTLNKVESFKDELLQTHNWYLISLRGIGYAIVQPSNQTGEAMKKLRGELSRAVNQAMKALVFVNEQMLSLDGARENAEAKAKLAALKTLHSGAVPLKRIA